MSVKVMSYFRDLSDDCPDLSYSPLLRAARLTLKYAQDHGAIGLTKTGAFKRVFVHWAAKHFDWPGMSKDQLLELNKVLNEYDFLPLELLHFVLVKMKLARHYKGEFCITKRGAELLKSPAALFSELIPFFLFDLDHASYSRTQERPVGNWNVWLNVLNVEADQGTSAAALYDVLYGPMPEESAGWREFGTFRSCVLVPLCWAGLLAEVAEPRQRLTNRQYFKTPLWRSALQLDTDNELRPAQLH
ncbi:hypothetical protein [Ostreiculturibacter nitratireducens]|uniref:hypothetical protein n=1 Tax=Ostreiculturibacter nitratireducens TaxID=3075226 RepID=UPI003CCC8D78